MSETYLFTTGDCDFLKCERNERRFFWLDLTSKIQNDPENGTFFKGGKL